MTDPALSRAPSAKRAAGYLLRLSRPRFWLYLGGPVVVGAVYAARTPAELFSPIAIALFAYFLVPANAFLYGVNDIFDADVDAENPKKDGREVRYRGDLFVPGVVVLSGILGLAFVPFLPTAAALGMFAFVLLSVEYSAPPLRFKTTPPLDSVSNGLYVLPAVIAYAAIAESLPPAAAIAGGWLWTMGMHTFSAIPDIGPDRAAGIETTATVLGASRTYLYCGGCWVVAASMFGAVHPLLAALFCVYPAFLAFVIVSEIPIDRAYWWFPALNTAVGTILTVGGLWVMIYG